MDKKLDVGNRFLMQISKSENFNEFFALTMSSEIIFINSKTSRIRGIHKAKNDIFFSGSFRKSTLDLFSITKKKKGIDILSVRDGSVIRSFKDASGPIYTSCFSNQGTRLLSAGNEPNIKIWNIPTQESEECIQTSYGLIRKLSFLSSHSNIFGSSCYNGMINLYDLRQKKRLISTFKHGCPVENFLFCNNEKDIISIGGNSIKIWSIFQNKLIFDLKTEKPVIGCSSFNKNGIFYNTCGQEIRYYDFKKSSCSSFYTFNKEMSSFEIINNKFLFNFIDGRLCFKNNLKPKYKKSIMFNENILLNLLKYKKYKLKYMPRKKRLEKTFLNKILNKSKGLNSDNKY